MLKQLSQNGLLWFRTLSPNLAPQTVKTALKMEEKKGIILMQSRVRQRKQFPVV